LRDFEQHFGVDRKTAWEYLRKLLAAGLLRHNQKHSAAVRYALKTRFLVVRADTLEPKIKEALSDLPHGLAAQVVDWVIAGGGEAFWEEDWHNLLDAAQRQEVISRLQAAGLLEIVYQAGDQKRLQLPRRWLQN
jgi:hypothetical protein